MNRCTRAAVAVALTATVGLSVGACGSDGDDYAVPTTYGANGQCYYANSPAEVVLLQQQGLCPVNWVPVHAPDYWLVQYALFYSSPRYYERYVPSYQRTTYKITINNYEKTHKSQIDKAESTYRQQRTTQQQRRQSTKTYGSTGRGDRAGGSTYSRSSSSSRSSSTRSYSSGGRH